MTGTYTSAIGAALDYLADAATVAYAAYTASTGTVVQVIDGPPLAASESTITSLVWIGYDPTNPDEPAGVGDQEFVNLNTTTRNENFQLVNTIEYWSGDSGNVRAVRDGAFQLFAIFELLVRGRGGNPGDTTLGGAVMWSQIAGGESYAQDSGSGGLIGRIIFHVSARARLTTIGS